LAQSSSASRPPKRACQFRQIDAHQQLLQRLVGYLHIEMRIEQLATQAAQQHVGALRQEQHFCPLPGGMTLTAAGPPQSSQRTQQRAFSAATGADDQSRPGQGLIVIESPSIRVRVWFGVRRVLARVE
jgi:hypothetical protein